MVSFSPPPLPNLPPSQTPHKNLLTPPPLPPISNLRPRRHNLVQFPRAAHQLPRLAEPDHRRARADGPDRLRVHEPLLLPVVHGDHGGGGPQEAIAGHVRGGVEEELDGVAGGAGRELQVCAAGAPGVGCECG